MTDENLTGDLLDDPSSATLDASTGAAAPDDASLDSPTSATDDPSPAPAGPTGRVRIPDDTKGHYVVLFARKPKRGENLRPHYVEVACVKAGSPDAAKRAVMAEDAPHGPYLRHSAAQKPGILLRAVPAMHWPQDVQPTTYDRPAPVLQIG